MASPQNNPGGYPPPPQPGPNPYPYGPPPPGANPYPYGPPPPAPNAYYYPPPQRSFGQRLCSCIINLLFLFIIFTLIVWLLFRPRLPQFYLNSLSLSNLNASGSHVSGNWSADLHSFNPNSKMHIYYTLVESEIYYKDELLSSNRVPPFEQWPRAESQLSANMVAASAYADEHVVGELNNDHSRNTLRFDVVVSAVARFQAPGWWSMRRRMLWVLCLHTPMGTTNNTVSMVSGSRKCYVHL